MAKKSFAEWLANVTLSDVSQAFQRALATILSGKNEDESDWSLPVEVVGGAGGGASNVAAGSEAVPGLRITGAARSTDNAGADVANPGWRGVYLWLDVTATNPTPISDGSNIRVELQIKNERTGDYLTVFRSNAVAAVTKTRYLIIGQTTTDNVGALQGVSTLPLVSTFRAFVDHTGPAQFTYTLDVQPFI